jgi:hypothetical protein
MSPVAFPAFFYSANSASIKAQKTYLWLFRSTLLLLIFGALLGSISATSTGWQQGSRVLSAILLGLSFLLSSTLKNPFARKGLVRRPGCCGVNRINFVALPCWR